MYLSQRGVGLYFPPLPGGGGPGYNTGFSPGLPGGGFPGGQQVNQFTVPGTNHEISMPSNVEEWLKLAGDAWRKYQEFTDEGGAGGGACWDYNFSGVGIPCAGSPDYDSVIKAMVAAPQHVIDEICQKLRKSWSGKGPNSREELLQPGCVPYWVRGILGGNDCVNKRYPDFPDWFRGIVQKYGLYDVDDLVPVGGGGGGPYTPGTTSGLAKGGLLPLLAVGLAVGLAIKKAR